MHSVSAHRALAFALTLGLASTQLVALASIGDVAADHVVGQPNATSRTPNVSGIDASGLQAPTGAAFDAAGNLFVVDSGNNRVLGYRSPMTTNTIADIVIGQPDFNSNTYNNGGVSASSLASPYALAVSAAGDLYVADYSNSRILEYDRPFDTDTVADFVIGQPDFTTGDSNEENVSARTLFTPSDVDIDAAGNLWVVDYGHNRVLEYDDPVATGDVAADLVLGQPSFTTSQYNSDVTDAKSFRGAFVLALDSHQNVWVVDYGCNRVLEFDDPTRLDATADRVLGQPSFSSSVPNYTGTVDAAGLFGPSGLSIDANDNVYVCDTSNNRVLMYSSPTATSDRIADRVFGQPDFASGAANTGGISARTLSRPLGIVGDAAGNLAVADYDNNRVVLLEMPTPIVSSLQVKVSRAGKPRLLVRGFGMASGNAVVEVDGTPLSTTRYKETAADGTAHRLVALDADFDTLVPPGVRVQVTVYNPQTGARSAPIPFTR